jgi:hypothetical protein
MIFTLGRTSPPCPGMPLILEKLVPQGGGKTLRNGLTRAFASCRPALTRARLPRGTAGTLATTSWQFAPLSEEKMLNFPWGRVAS